MCDKKVITPNGKKLYLATFELFIGQYGQIFYQAFYAKNKKQLEKKIHKYLKEYYGEENTPKVKKDDYYYFDGEVSVKKHDYEEITDFKQLVNKLL